MSFRNFWSAALNLLRDLERLYILLQYSRTLLICTSESLLRDLAPALFFFLDFIEPSPTALETDFAGEATGEFVSSASSLSDFSSSASLSSDDLREPDTPQSRTGSELRRSCSSSSGTELPFLGQSLIVAFLRLSSDVES